MDDDELKRLEAQYLGDENGFPNTNLDDFDINAYLQKIENPIKESDIEALTEKGDMLPDFDFDSFKIGNDYNMENIDRMLAELDLPRNHQEKKQEIEEFSSNYKPNVSIEVFNEVDHTLNNGGIEKHDSPKKDYLTVNTIPVLSHKSSFQVDNTSNSSKKDSRKGSHEMATVSRPASKTMSPAFHASPLLTGSKKNYLNTDYFSDNNKKGPERKSSDSRLLRTFPTTSDNIRLSTPEEDESWIEEIGKKIRYGEVEFIHEKTKIENDKVQAMAEAKNRGVRSKGLITLDKGREFRLGDTIGSNFKIAMNKFDQIETKNIKELKRKRESHMFSALENAAYDISSMSSVVFDKGSSLQEIIKNQITGNLSCFAYSQDRSLLVVATEAGEIIEVDLVTKKCRKQTVSTKISSIDISPDKEKYIAALSTGEIYVKKTNGAWASKRQRIDEKPIVMIRFVTNELVVASTDWCVMRLVVKDLKVMIDVTKSFVLRQSSEIITQITVRKIRDEYRLVVATLNCIVLYSISSDASKELSIIDKPEYVKEGSVPYVSWISTEDLSSHFLIIFWHTFVLMIKDEGANSFIGGMKQLNRKIIWGCAIKNRVVCLIFDDMEVNFESIQNIFANLISGGGFETQFKLTKIDYSSRARNVCVNYEGNICQSWSESIKSYDNNIYLLKTDAIFHVYYSSLLEMVRSSSDRGEWIQAFKLCSEVWNGKIVSSKEEKESLKKEAATLANQYIDRFLDKTRKGEDMHGKITRICIDAMISTGNQAELFGRIRSKIDEISFWREIEIFIEAGLINYIPLDALKEGGIYLLSESLQHMVYQYHIQDFANNEDDFNQLVILLKRRKLWPSLYRLGILYPDPTLALILSSMLADLMAASTQESISPIKNRLRDVNFQVDESTNEFFDNKQNSAYFRTFWYLQKIVTWNVHFFYDISSPSEELWIKVIEWLLEPANMKVLSKINISLFLELFFDLFLNVEFTSSDKVAACLQRKVNMFKEAMEDDETDLNENNQGSYIFRSSIKILFKFLDYEFSVDVAFLSLKLITLSVFAGILDEHFTVRQTVITLLSRPFVGERLWFHFEPISKDDLEEQIIRVINSWKNASLTEEDSIMIEELAKTNQFFRVMCHMIELRQGVIEALHAYVKNVNYGSSTYLFNWIKRKLVDLRPESIRIEFSKELIHHLDYLISKNKSKAKEIIVMIPNVGIEAIESLK